MDVIERNSLISEYEESLEHGNISKVEECLRRMYESGDVEFNNLIKQSHGQLRPRIESRIIDEEQIEIGLRQIAAPGCLNEIENTDTCLECGNLITEGEFCTRCSLILVQGDTDLFG